MGIALIIVGGIIVLTAIAIAGDVISTKYKAAVRAPKQEAIAPLEARLEALEARLDERDETVRKLQEELRFVNRMLEDKTAK